MIRVMVVGREDEGVGWRSSCRMAVPTFPPGYGPGRKSVNKRGVGGGCGIGASRTPRMAMFFSSIVESSELVFWFKKAVVDMVWGSNDLRAVEFMTLYRGRGMRLYLFQLQIIYC